MRLKIHDKPFAEAKISIDGLKKDLTSIWNLEEAIKKNTIFTYSDFNEERTNRLTDFILSEINWGTALTILGEVKEKYIELKFFYVNYSQWNLLYPGIMYDDLNYDFTCISDNGNGILLVQSLIPDIDFDFKNFIARRQYTYASNDTKKVGWLKK